MKTTGLDRSKRRAHNSRAAEGATSGGRRIRIAEETVAPQLIGGTPPQMTRPKQRNLTYTVRAPKWNAADRSSINCLVTFKHLPSEVPFTATPHDCEPHGREIYQRIVAGEFGEIAPFEPPPPQAPMLQEAHAALEAFWQTPQGKELASGISLHNEEVASGSSRGIVTHAEAILSDRLATLLITAGISPAAAEKMTFSGKITKAAAGGAISAKEQTALDLLKKIRNEVAHEKAGTFYTENVRLLANSLQSCLSGCTAYKPTTSLSDKWIDLIFIDAYSILNMSLEARANPGLNARIVS